MAHVPWKGARKRAGRGASPLAPSGRGSPKVSSVPGAASAFVLRTTADLPPATFLPAFQAGVLKVIHATILRTHLVRGTPAAVRPQLQAVVHSHCLPLPRALLPRAKSARGGRWREHEPGNGLTYRTLENEFKELGGAIGTRSWGKDLNQAPTVACMLVQDFLVFLSAGSSHREPALT